MDFPKSVPNVGLVGGKFVDENPVTGTPGSLIPAQWGNAVTTEILGVIQKAGLTPNEADNGQLADAILAIVTSNSPSAATETNAGILKLSTGPQTTAGADDATAVTPKKLQQKLATVVQTQALTAFTTGGPAPAFTLTPAPVITAYVANQRFQVTFSASGMTPTLNVSGLGPKNLKQYNSIGTKVAATVINGQVSDVVYDGTDFVVLDQLPAINQATEILIGGGMIATQALTNAGADDNTIITPKKLLGWVTAGVAQATEALFGIAKIATQAIVNSGTDDVTIVTPKKLKSGFMLSLAPNGYIIFPVWLGSIILQWGAVASSTGGTITYPITFPNNVFVINGTVYASGAGGYNLNYGVSPGLASVSYMLSVAGAHRWWAIGN